MIFNPAPQSPTNFDTLGARDDSPARLHQAGVKVILSSYGWSNNVRRLRQLAGRAIAYGLPSGEALRAISQTPATVFGRGHAFGSIKAGMFADLVLWSGDPFEVTSIAEGIWIQGQRQSLRSRQEQLAERYAKRLGLRVDPGTNGLGHAPNR